MQGTILGKTFLIIIVSLLHFSKWHATGRPLLTTVWFGMQNGFFFFFAVTTWLILRLVGQDEAICEFFRFYINLTFFYNII